VTDLAFTVESLALLSFHLRLDNNNNFRDQ